MLKNVSGVLDHIVARLPTRPATYLFLWMVWAVTLWVLSAGNSGPKHDPDMPHLDKVVHFLYFFGGGALLAAHGGLKWSEVKFQRLFWGVALICCMVGRLDEYHQEFTPGRCGNDNGDWLADTLGGAAGALWVMWVMLPRMRGGQGKEAQVVV